MNDMSWWLAHNRLHSLGTDPLARFSHPISGHISLISTAIPPPGSIQSRVDSDEPRAAVRQTSRVATPGLNFDSTKQRHLKGPVQACRLISQTERNPYGPLRSAASYFPYCCRHLFKIQVLIPRSSRSSNLALERCCLHRLD